MFFGKRGQLTDEIRKEIIKLKEKSIDYEKNPFTESEGYVIVEELLANGKV